MEHTITVFTNIPVNPGVLYDHETTARLAGIKVRMLLRYWRRSIVTPSLNTGRYGIFFDDECIYRLRQAEFLRREHQINMTGVKLILNLNQRVEALNSELSFLRNQVRR